MDLSGIKLPLYLKVTILLAGLLAICFIMSTAQGIFVPFAFAGLLSILLLPLVGWLERLHFPRIIAILISVIIALLVIVMIFYFFSVQIGSFSEDLPNLRNNFDNVLLSLKKWVSDFFGVSANYLDELGRKEMQEGPALGQTFFTLTGFLFKLILLPIYTFLLLYYRPLITSFLSELVSKEDNDQMKEILSEIRVVIMKFVSGLLIETAIVAALNIAGLSLLGIKYPFLLGVLGAFLNMIPYVGGIVSVSLPMGMALATGMPYNLLWQIPLVYLIIQLIDNYLLVPRIVASKVRINALFSIIAILSGNIIWGLAGMFLFIPIIAILKIIFDRIEHLKPWGRVLGDELPGEKRRTLNDRVKSTLHK